MLEIERDFFRLREFGFLVRRLVGGGECRGFRGCEFVGGFSERHDRLARLVVGLTGDRFGIDHRHRNANRLLSGIRRAARLRFRLRRLPFRCRLWTFELGPVLTLSV